MIRIGCAAVLALVVACGHRASGTGGDGDAAVDDGTGGGDGGSIDAPPFSGMCEAGGPQCSNCQDDDGDGFTDGFDPQCTGPSDNDERTFATGIPGDNKDAVDQDCFFDGDSGAGNDRCNIHVCCLLGAKTVEDCTIGQTRYDPRSCPPPIGNTPIAPDCIERCGALTPPGCDCFGCCTICDPINHDCHDILINPADSKGCGPTTLGDPTKCLTCTKITECGSTQCGGQTCILCPGQDPATLPQSCNGMTSCPDGRATCIEDGACPEGNYCSSGCCIAVIE
jgi:hypothetical protein